MTGSNYSEFRGHNKLDYFWANSHEPSQCWWHYPVGHFGGRTTWAGGSPRPSQPKIINVDKTKIWQATGMACHILIQNEQLEQMDMFPSVPWVADYRKWCVYGGIPYQVKDGQASGASLQKIGQKSQHTDLNEDTTNENASMACSNVRLWKLNIQKEWRNTSWRLWDERAEKDSAGFVDSKENKCMGS